MGDRYLPDQCPPAPPRQGQDGGAWPAELASAARRLRVLVLGIRPSIARRCGLPATGTDRLDGDGVIGWQVGVRQLGSELAAMVGPPDGTAFATWCALCRWCEEELAAEAGRWSSADDPVRHPPPLVAVEHVELLRAALQACDNGR